MRRGNGEGGGVDKEGDATVKRIWAEWNSLSDDELSPVKTISSTLGITNAEVAEVVYPADQFGPWADDQEPMRPSFPTEDVMLFDSTDPTPRPMKNAVMVELGFISRHGFELVPVEVRDPLDDGDSWTGVLPATLSAHGAAAFVGDGSATLHGDGDRLSRITPAGPKAGCGVIVG